ncbi:MAG TPA: epimerase [Desulfuromonas sp.]|nr:epimerase [Desulfuromonas sp.]
MKVIISGATGMVGQGVLRECLTADDVEQVAVVGRTKLTQVHPKIHQVICPDLMHADQELERLQGFDACFFCLGVSSSGMSEERYRQVTYDLTLGLATVLAKNNPGMTFVYVSGAGTDSSEQGKSMWARVKGATENALQKLSVAGVYLFRPGVIQPFV